MSRQTDQVTACSNSNGSLESAGRTDSVDQSQSDTGEVFLPGFMCISYEDILRDLPLFPGQYFLSVLMIQSCTIGLSCFLAISVQFTWRLCHGRGFSYADASP